MKERPNAGDIVGINCAHPWNQGMGGSDIGERTEAFMGRRVDKQRPVALDAIEKEGQQGQLATSSRRPNRRMLVWTGCDNSGDSLLIPSIVNSVNSGDSAAWQGRVF